MKTVEPTNAEREAFRLLGFNDDPDKYDALTIDTRWRTMRSQLHPDRHQDDPNAGHKFDQTRKAYELARAYTLKPKPCRDCGGTGKILRDSPNPLMPPTRINCKTCKGSGSR